MKLALIIIGSSIAILAGLVGTIYAATQAFDKTKTDEHSFAQTVHEIVIDAESGDVELVAGGDDVEVREKRHYLFDSPDVSRSIEDGVLTLKSECDGGSFILCETDYRVEVPEGVTVSVETHVGDIEAKGISARRIKARSNVGDVRIESARRADVEARTNVGDIDVEMPDGTYNVDTDTEVGQADVDDLVTYDLAKRTISAQSDVGDVNVSAR